MRAAHRLAGPLREAVLARRLAQIADLLADRADPLAPWPAGGNALTWAVAHGDMEVLDLLLPGADDDQDGRRAAMAIAREWIGTGVEAMLRRRLDGELTREPLPPHPDQWRQATVVRITAPDGRSVWAADAHRAALTALEWSVGIVPPPDELLERALHHADPDSDDWNECVSALTGRHDPARPLRWALGRLRDPRPAARRFAADVVLLLGMAGEPDPEAVSALRPLLETEDDGYVLTRLVRAFLDFHGPPEAVPARAASAR